MPDRRDCIDEILDAIGNRVKRSQLNERLGGINDRAEAYESDAPRRKKNWPYTCALKAERRFQFRSHTIT
jgi:hypothetical protein